jgi:hypothetical protein
MPDIAMCSGEGCTRRDTCYRHTAKPSEHWQSWFSVPPLASDGTCPWYWHIDAERSGGTNG